MHISCITWCVRELQYPLFELSQTLRFKSELVKDVILVLCTEPTYAHEITGEQG